MLISLSFVVACKKSKQEPKNELESSIRYSDSLYFKIGDRIYKGNNANSNGVLNGQTNVKPFTDKIPNRKASYETAGMFWYGDVDSTFYGVHSGFDLNDAEVKIAFTKKMLTANLLEDNPVKVYRNNQEFFKLGKRTFSTDFEMENSTDGVVFKVYDREQIYKSGLTSSRPGFSIFLRPDMEKDFQKRFKVRGFQCGKFA
ncbi:MAG: hypothetical protein EOO96_03035 [Pedobacter sp.]|nr:MAG: hypothetical protein EOO96_03035 [Pedobacter sp.]